MPAVSIILPTYNRARFLPQALQSIRDQQWTDWELIIVDDGSTDETDEIIGDLTASIEQPVKFIRQENQGPYGARNTGLDHASGRYIAFFDSDDEWLPHHLKDCVDALERNRDVDWAYGACRMVDDSTGETITENTFYRQGRPRPFMELQTRSSDALRIIEDDRALECMILHGTFSGLQNSVIRRSLLNDVHFDAAERNEAEDQLAVARALAADHRLGYFDAVHVVYRVHAQNSSAAGLSRNIEKERRVIRLMAEGYERLSVELNLEGRAKRALRRRLGRLYFWTLGYSLYWDCGDRAQAMTCFRKGLRHWPWQPSTWKTYTIAAIRSWVVVQKIRSAPDGTR